MASTGYGPSGASAATEKFMFFCGKPGTFADFKFRFEIFIKAQGHVDVIHMKIAEYRTHISSHETRSKDSAERARKGLVESAAIASLLVQRVSKEVLDVLRKSLPSEQVTDGREMWEHGLNSACDSRRFSCESRESHQRALVP